MKKARAWAGSCTPTSAMALPQPRSMGKCNWRAGQQGQMRGGKVLFKRVQLQQSFPEISVASGEIHGGKEEEMVLDQYRFIHLDVAPGDGHQSLSNSGQSCGSRTATGGADEMV
jgi:hypothetical protein